MYLTSHMTRIEKNPNALKTSKSKNLNQCQWIKNVQVLKAVHHKRYEVINTGINRLSSVAFLLHVNNNSIHMISKKAELFLIHKKNQNYSSFLPSFRD